MNSNRIFFYILMLCCAGEAAGMEAPEKGSNKRKAEVLGEIDERPLSKPRLAMDVPKYDNLHAAIKHGDEKSVILLCNQGADLNEKDPAYGSCLNHAVWQDNARMVDALRSHGATLEKGNDSPLFLATSKEMVEFLHKKCGADIHEKASDGKTILHYAASEGKKEIVKYGIQNFVDYRIRDESGDRAYRHADKRTDDGTSIRAMLGTKESVRKVVLGVLQGNSVFALRNREIGNQGYRKYADKK